MTRSFVQNSLWVNLLLLLEMLMVPSLYGAEKSPEAVREEAIIRARETIGAAQFLSIPPSEPSG